MEWVIGFIIIVVIVAVAWWLLNRNSNRSGSPDSLDHAPGTLQHGFSDVGQQVPVTFSHHDASTPSAGSGLGGKAAMTRDEAAARRRTDDTKQSHPSGSSRVEREPVNPNEPFEEDRMAAGTGEDVEPRTDGNTESGPDHLAEPRGEAATDRQGSGVEPVAENSSGDWDIDDSETVVSRPDEGHTDGPVHRQDT